MSKIIEAYCELGVIRHGGKEVESAIKLCEGEAPSEGALLFDGERKYYVTNTQPDLKETIEQLISALNAIVVMGATWGGALNIPTELAALNNLKDNLK